MIMNHGKTNLNHNKTWQRGFTLIELLIVMSIIGILASIVVPNYKRNLIKAREAVLMEDLYQMRRAIDAYFADNISYPESLDDLVANKYIRDIPRDPFTKSTDTWEEIPPTPSIEGEIAEGGVENVLSGSDLVGLNGIPYRDW
jgi:general secretion pathway protein G